MAIKLHNTNAIFDCLTRKLVASCRGIGVQTSLITLVKPLITKTILISDNHHGFVLVFFCTVLVGYSRIRSEKVTNFEEVQNFFVV